MKLSHHIKLIIPRIRWIFKKKALREAFIKRESTFDSLSEQEKELELKYNELRRSQPNVSISDNSLLAKLHYTRGKRDLIKELLCQNDS